MITLKTNSLTGTYVHVYSGDEAIDKEAKDWKHGYQVAMDTGDLEKLPVKAGQQPCIWHLRHLTGESRSRAQDLTVAQAKEAPVTSMRRMVAMALTRVENLIDESTGEPFEIKRKAYDKNIAGVDPEQMDAIAAYDDGDLLVELFQRVQEALNGSGNS